MVIGGLLILAGAALLVLKPKSGTRPGTGRRFRAMVRAAAAALPAARRPRPRPHEPGIRRGHGSGPRCGHAGRRFQGHCPDGHRPERRRPQERLRAAQRRTGHRGAAPAALRSGRGRADSHRRRRQRRGGPGQPDARPVTGHVLCRSGAGSGVAGPGGCPVPPHPGAGCQRGRRRRRGQGRQQAGAARGRTRTRGPHAELQDPLPGRLLRAPDAGPCHEAPHHRGHRAAQLAAHGHGGHPGRGQRCSAAAHPDPGLAAGELQAGPHHAAAAGNDLPGDRPRRHRDAGTRRQVGSALQRRGSAGRSGRPAELRRIRLQGQARRGRSPPRTLRTRWPTRPMW